MIRTLNDIQDQIIEKIQSDEILSQKLSSNSKEAVWRRITYVVSFGIWIFEKLLNQHKKEINEEIAATRIHTQKWYREKALEFMYGYTVDELGNYDTSQLTDEQIASSKIIANAAAVKVMGYLRLKVVKRSGDELVPLTPAELSSFSSYMNYVTDAGTYVIPTTNIADDLKLTLDIYYDDLILAGDGSRLDGTDLNGVLNAIKSYLKSLRFNGAFIESHVEKEIEAIDGVSMVKVKGAWSKYGTYSYESTHENVGRIDEVRVADAGYMKLDEANTIINYIPFRND